EAPRNREAGAAVALGAIAGGGAVAEQGRAAADLCCVQPAQAARWADGPHERVDVVPVGRAVVGLRVLHLLDRLREPTSERGRHLHGEVAALAGGSRGDGAEPTRDPARVALEVV